jgi:hypothetical protein
MVVFAAMVDGAGGHCGAERWLKAGDLRRKLACLFGDSRVICWEKLGLLCAQQFPRRGVAVIDAAIFGDAPRSLKEQEQKRVASFAGSCGIHSVPLAGRSLVSRVDGRIVDAAVWSWSMLVFGHG